MEKQKIRSFTDLKTWKLCHQLVLLIYKYTRSFPKEELFALTSQTRRAAVSISANIAEGFSRTTYKEKKYFYSISLGSLNEVENYVYLSKDLNYLDNSQCKELINSIFGCKKMLRLLIKSIPPP